MKAIIDREAFSRALANGCVSAGKEKGRDALHHLELTFGGTDQGTPQLTVAATDSYMLTRETVPCDMSAEGGVLLVNRADAEQR